VADLREAAQALLDAVKAADEEPLRDWRPVEALAEALAAEPTESLDAATAPVIDDYFPDASFEMRRGWEAAIRVLSQALPERDRGDDLGDYRGQMVPNVPDA
jgi:hypothetical protein